MTRLGSTFEPNAQNRQIYDELYASVYCQMYERLLPLYREIQRITKPKP